MRCLAGLGWLLRLDDQGTGGLVMDKFNSLCLHDSRGTDYRVNISAIASYGVKPQFDDDDDGQTWIYLVGGQSFAVRESVDEIDQAIDNKLGRPVPDGCVSYSQDTLGSLWRLLIDIEFATPSGDKDVLTAVRNMTRDIAAKAKRAREIIENDGI